MLNLKRHLVQWYDLDTFAFTTACGRVFERDEPLGIDDTYETERTTTQAERIECGNCRRSRIGLIVIQRNLNPIPLKARKGEGNTCGVQTASD